MLQVCLLNYRKDGTPFYNQFYLSPITDDEGVVTHYLGVQTDVTEQIEQGMLTAVDTGIQ